jgi:hypothetical protein
MDLPQSLAVKPNIPFNKQTKEQLFAERDYWQSRLDAATGWGGGVGVASSFVCACNAELKRRFPS